MIVAHVGDGWPVLSMVRRNHVPVRYPLSALDAVPGIVGIIVCDATHVAFDVAAECRSSKCPPMRTSSSSDGVHSNRATASTAFMRKFSGGFGGIKRPL